MATIARLAAHMTAWEILADVLACPNCRAARPRIETTETVCERCGARYERHDGTLKLDTPLEQFSDDWRRRQEDSVVRYEVRPEMADPTIARLFAGFVSFTIAREATVLDVGSGPDFRLPEYAVGLPVSCYIGLEPLAPSRPRDYICLGGAVAEDVPLVDDSIDAVIFAVSLDHIEDVPRALDEAKRVLKPTGSIYIWSNLYEPAMFARTKTFHEIIYVGTLRRRFTRVALVTLVLAKTLVHMLDRAYRLRRGMRLDDHHERYYTSDSLNKTLQNAGLAMSRQLVVPGSSSLFAECKLGR